MLPAELDDSLRGTPGGGYISSDSIERRRVQINVGLGRDMVGRNGACDPLFHSRPRITNLAQDPIRKAKVS